MTRLLDWIQEHVGDRLWYWRHKQRPRRTLGRAERSYCTECWSVLPQGAVEMGLSMCGHCIADALLRLRERT